MAGLDQIRHHLPAADRLEGEEGNSRPLGPPAATPHTPPRATQAPLPTDSAHFESMARTQFYAHCKVSSLRIKRALCGPKRKTAGDMAREEASTDFTLGVPNLIKPTNRIHEGIPNRTHCGGEHIATPPTIVRGALNSGIHTAVVNHQAPLPMRAFPWSETAQIPKPSCRGSTDPACILLQACRRPIARTRPSDHEVGTRPAARWGCSHGRTS